MFTTTEEYMSSLTCGCDPQIDWKCSLHHDWNTGGPVLAAGAITGKRAQIAPEDRPTNTPDIASNLRKDFPYGHPRFLPTTLKELKLHSDKNHDYAKGGEPLGNFSRVSQILSLYPDLKLSDQRVVALVYAMKQLDAVLWGLNSHIEYKVEGLNSRLQDIAVYAKLVICMNDDLEAAK
jgi:hypothetical protein